MSHCLLSDWEGDISILIIADSDDNADFDSLGHANTAADAYLSNSGDDGVPANLSAPCSRKDVLVWISASINDPHRLLNVDMVWWRR